MAFFDLELKFLKASENKQQRFKSFAKHSPQISFLEFEICIGSSFDNKSALYLCDSSRNRLGIDENISNKSVRMSKMSMYVVGLVCSDELNIINSFSVQ